MDKKTPLYDFHVANGGKIVSFAGWLLPVNYPDGLIAEHNHTRAHASIFDVSHMTQFEVRGENAGEQLEKIVPGGISKLKNGNAKYSALTNSSGGIVDDLIITNAGDYFYCVSNASRRNEDLDHIKTNLPNLNIIERDDLALIALQGPTAIQTIAKWAPEVNNLAFMQSGIFDFAGIEVRISRLGYTGEDGVEISASANEITTIAEKLLEQEEVKLAGLGARDSLRLEACLCLYGNDIDEATTPIEAGLNWIIPKRRRLEGGFIGDTRILGELANGASKKLVAISPVGRAPARQGTQICDDDHNVIGKVTSGGFSPTLQKPISLGYVQTENSGIGNTVFLNVRGKYNPAEIVSMPFVQHNYFRK